MQFSLALLRVIGNISVQHWQARAHRGFIKQLVVAVKDVAIAQTLVLLHLIISEEMVWDGQKSILFTESTDTTSYTTRIT